MGHVAVFTFAEALRMLKPVATLGLCAGGGFAVQTWSMKESTQVIRLIEPFLPKSSGFQKVKS